MLIVLCVVFVIVLCCIGVSALKDAPPIGVHWFYIVSVGAVAAYLGMMRTTRVV